MGRIKDASCGVGCCCPLCNSEMAAVKHLSTMKDQTFYSMWLQQAQDALHRKFGVTRAASKGTWRTFRTSGPQSGPIEALYEEVRMQMVKKDVNAAPPPPDMRAAILAARGKSGTEKSNADLTPRERMQAALKEAR